MDDTNNKLTLSNKDIAKKAFENIKEELLNENVEMVRDYLKGAYRLRNDLEKQVKVLQAQMKDIDAATAKVEEGDIDDLKNLKIPAKYLSEKTARLADIDWDQD